MSTSPRKTLSLGERNGSDKDDRSMRPIHGKTVYVPEKPTLASVSSDDFTGEEGFDYPASDNYYQEKDLSAYKNSSQKGSHGREDNNKIRRGPGRRLAKEKRPQRMDPALINKYSSLPPALQEKVNATIEIYYQQHMAKAYRGEVEADVPALDQDHYDTDLVYETEE